MLNTYQSLVRDGATVEYAAARSCGAALKLFMASILIPLSRVSYTKLQNSDFGKYLGLNHRVMDHKLLATGITTLSVMHAVSHYYHDSSNYTKLPGVTGVTMLASMVVPIGGAYLLKNHTKKLTSASYEVSVMNPHRLGAAAFLVAYAMHTPDWRLMKYAFASCVPLIIDRFVEKTSYRYHTIIHDAEKIPNTDYMRLKLLRPEQFTRFIPGQYALLSVPSLEGLFEFSHPFTLVNDNGRELEFVIKNTGPWTNKLYNWIGNGGNDVLAATVTGPFGGALFDAQTVQGLTMIGTGIGMTPTLAVLNAIASGIIEVNNLKIHVSARNSSELAPVVHALSSAIESQPEAIIEANVYVTGSERNALRNLNASNLTFFSPSEPRRETRRMTSSSHLFVPIHHHRPDLPEIIGQSSAVSVCGNTLLVNMADKITQRMGIRCHLESF